MFDKNSLILSRVVEAIATNTNDGKLMGRWKEIENASISVTADGTDITNAVGTPITTLYGAKAANIDFDLSFFSLDMAALQLGSDKEVATTETKIVAPSMETHGIVDNKVTLKFTPKGTVKYVYLVSAGDIAIPYELTTGVLSADSKNFTISGKEITLPEGTTGSLFVEYKYEATEAVKITAADDKFPEVAGLTLKVLFCDPCDSNIEYGGYLVSARAKVDPSSVSIGLNRGDKHSASFKLNKSYCDDNGELFSLIVVND